jgi:hypothetical protein
MECSVLWPDVEIYPGANTTHDEYQHAHGMQYGGCCPEFQWCASFVLVVAYPPRYGTQETRYVNREFGNE